jgi:aminopeptidase YwaD
MKRYSSGAWARKNANTEPLCSRGLRQTMGMKWGQICAVLAVFMALPAGVWAQKAPLLPASQATAIAQELSGALAHRNLEALAVYHRIRGSHQFHLAAETVVDRLHAYGLADAHIETFPADGKIYYGTLKTRPAWDADFAELWQLGQQGGSWVPAVRLASWDTQPISLADDSESADVTADLVDVGTGRLESDYAGKDVRGKIVLVSAQPSAVARLAVTRFGAVGIVSYAGNQGGAWAGENVDLVRWGSLYPTTAAPPVKTFAFMVSRSAAEALQAQLARGEEVRLHAVVRAGERPGNYEVVTATIPGADPQLRKQEINFSCHLDHERPGANDNLSGCVTILEVARTLQKLIDEGRIPRPARTLRFIWGPEGEGTMSFLVSHPDIAKSMLACIHLDMVGGIPSVTGSVFQIKRTPASLPSITSDIAEAFGEFVNRQSEYYAGSGHDTPYALVSGEGGKGALQAEFGEYTGGSDQEIYDDSSFAIPAIYMDDYPDRYIHSNFDSAANIDATKLKRAAFISAASGYYLANFSTRDIPAMLAVIEQRRAIRLEKLFEREATASPEEVANLERFAIAFERGLVESINKFAPLEGANRAAAEKSLAAFAAYVGTPPPEAPATGDAARVYRRNPDLKGPVAFGPINYFNNKVAPEVRASLKIFHIASPGMMQGGGGSYAFEILNFTDGHRTVQEIRDDVSAEYGPVPTEDVLAYLEACETVGIVERVQ